MIRLHISDSLSLPLDFVTQTQAILAKKGVGKTYTASVQAEELLKAHQQIVVIDPTGAWWGLKSSADGRSAGFTIAIFGGEHADVPLEESAGAVIASAIVEQRFSAIIDLSLFRKGQMNRFMAEFLENLYRLNREAMHLIIDEADMFAPQKPFAEQARTLGAMEDVVRRGRKRGIGCTMITQRPQVINKDVLTQCEIVTVLRLIHPKDINAIQEWVAVHGDEERYKEMKGSLPSLPKGTCYIWSPGWGDIFAKVKVRERETFNSSATPEPGEIQRTPKVIAQVDLQKLGEQIQSTIKKQKENDPAELRRKIAELTKQVASKSAAAPNSGAIQEAVNKAIAERTREHSHETAALRNTIQKLQRVLASIGQQVSQATGIEIPEVRPSVSPVVAVRQPVAHAHPKPVTNGNGPGEKIPRAERLILTALAQYPEGRTKVQIATLTGYAHTGGGFNNAVGSLRSNGYIGGADILRITDSGLSALGSYDPLPTGDELLRYWYGNLPKAERAILESLARKFPQSATKEEIATEAGYEPSGGGFNNALGKLRTLELISGRGELRASDTLFGA